MSKICYLPKTFRDRSLDLIRKVNDVLIEYDKMGYVLTLRQIYYQMVARAYIPNVDKEYKNLGNLINDARLAGMIDWNLMEDRTRNLESNSHWKDPADILRICADQFALDKWLDQPFHIEIWVEKQALEGIIERTARRLDVAYFACRGYVSQTEMHSAAMRMKKHKKPVIVHLGDHDPSGIDMTRDIKDRLKLFGSGHTEVRRIALNMDQIQLYNPPPNPAKLTDTRANDYIDRFGDESWELDALDPVTLDTLITDTVEEYKDADLYTAKEEAEAEDKKLLSALSRNWEFIEEHVKEEYWEDESNDEDESDDESDDY